jgi:hypothetical protein
MDGMKIIDASEVTTRKKGSKVEIKKISKGPMKIITDEGKKDGIENTSEIEVTSKPFTLKPDIIKAADTIVKPDIVVKPDVVKTIDIVSPTNVSKTIRAIKLKEDKYYGPKNANKNKFMRLYKKLGLKWSTEVSLSGVMVDGWFNSDKSQYIIKLLEDGDLKRFKFYGCDEIYDYFIDLGGVVFDHTKENSFSPNYLNNKANNVVSANESQIGVANQNGVISTVGGSIGDIVSVSDKINIKNTEDADEKYRFIGADLWAGFRVRQLLKKMPDNWGVIWK